MACFTIYLIGIFKGLNELNIDNTDNTVQHIINTMVVLFDQGFWVLLNIRAVFCKSTFESVTFTYAHMHISLISTHF